MPFETGIDISVNSRKAEQGAAKAKKAIRDVGDEAVKTEKKVKQATDKSSKGLGTMAQSAKAAASAFGALALADFARRFIQQADAMNLLSARIRRAAGDGGDFVRVQQRIFEISSRTGTALETNVGLFQRLAIGAREFGASNSDILKVTQAVQQLGVVGGASAASISAGTTQFAQAMASGVVRAEEFNSIVENIPEVAVAIADGLGVSVGELRKMVISGELLSKDVFTVLQKQSEEINEEFEKFPVTVERALNSAGIAFAQLNQSIDESIGLTGGLAQTIQEIADAMNALPRLMKATQDAIKEADEQAKEFLRSLPVIGSAVQAIENAGLRSRGEGPSNKVGLPGVANSDDLSGVRRSLGLGDFDKFREGIGFERRPTLDSIFGEEDLPERASDLKEIQKQLKAIRSELEQEKEAAMRAAEERSNFRGTLERELEERQRLLVAQREGEDAFERMKVAIENENRVIAIAGDLTSNYAKEMLKAADAVSAVERALEAEQAAQKKADEIRNKAIEKQKANAEEQARAFQKPFETAAENIQSKFADTFEDIIRDGEFSFKSLGDAILDIFIKTLAEMAALALARPIIVPVVQQQQSGAGGGGLGGLFGGGGGGGLGGLFGGGGGPSIPGGGLGGGFGGGQGPFGQFLGGAQGTAAGSNASNIGALFGAGGGTTPAGVSTSSPLLGGTGAGGGVPGGSAAAGAGVLAGAAFAGFAGNSLGNGIGRQLGNPGAGRTAGKAGGAVGGAAGAVVGTVIFPGLGTIAGAFIGSTLGSLFGSFFGNGPSNDSAGSFIDPNSLALSGINRETGEFTSERDAIQGAIQNGLAALKQDLGEGVFTSGAINVDVGGRDGIRINVNNENRFQGDDPEAATRVAIKAALDSFVSPSANINAALGASRAQGLDIEGTLENVKFARFVDDLVVSSTTLSEFEVAIQKVNNEFNPLILRAQSLGITTTKLIQARDLEIKSIREAAQARFEDLQGQEQSVGRQIEALFDAVLQPLEASLDAIRFSPDSALSVRDQFELAQTEFRDLQERAAAGDREAQVELGSAGQQVLELGRQMFASGPEFARLFEDVTGALETTFTQVQTEQTQVLVENNIQLIDTFEFGLAALEKQLKDIRAAIDRLTAAGLAAPV